MSLRDIMNEARENSEFTRQEMEKKGAPKWANKTRDVGAVIFVLGLLTILYYLFIK